MARSDALDSATSAASVVPNDADDAKHINALGSRADRLSQSHPEHFDNLRLQADRLPLSCPGCGAPSQIITAEQAGYYNLTRSGVRNFIREETNEEDKVMDEVLNNADKSLLSTLGLANASKATSTAPTIS